MITVTAYEKDKPKTLVELFSIPDIWGQIVGVQLRHNPAEELAEMTLDWKQCRFSILGGCKFVYGSDTEMAEEVRKKLCRAHVKMRDRYEDLEDWNDDFFRTQEHILQFVKDVGV